MGKKSELDIERVLHLVQFLRPANHVRNHDLCLCPRKILVDCVLLLVQFASEMIGESQQLGEADHWRSRILLLDF
jgi:chloramphenicol 3-O-phosphotransferase